MTVLSRWKTYKKCGKVQMRAHLVLEDMSDIRVDEKDKQNIRHEGGMIARCMADTSRQWYVSQSDFNAGYDQEEVC